MPAPSAAAANTTALLSHTITAVCLTVATSTVLVYCSGVTRVFCRNVQSAATGFLQLSPP